MKNHNTKPSNSQLANNNVISENIKIDAHDIKDCSDATSRFMNLFHVVKRLGECNAYKEKGVPIRIILLYIFNLMFSPMSMYYQIKMSAFHEDFSKNTVYRFLENIQMNWHLFLLRLSCVIIHHIAGLAEDSDGRYALLVDDSPLSKCGRAMELISRYFNHVTMGYEYGDRIRKTARTSMNDLTVRFVCEAVKGRHPRGNYRV